MKHSRYRPLASRGVLIPLVVILLVFVGIIGIAIWKHNGSTSTGSTASNAGQPKTAVNYSPSTEEDNQSNETRKGSTPPSPTDSKTGGSTLNSPSTPPPFSVTVSYANPNSDHSAIRVAANVNGATADGTCTITLKPASGNTNQPVTQTEKTQFSNQIYICPIKSIPAPKGGWNISVSVSSNGSTASADWAGGIVTL